jgi:hypothetical protein
MRLVEGPDSNDTDLAPADPPTDAPAHLTNPSPTPELELGPHGEMRDLKSLEYVLTDAIGQHLLDKYMSFNESTATTATNHDPWFPGCPVFDAINRDPEDGCNLIRFHKDCEWTNVEHTLWRVLSN